MVKRMLLFVVLLLAGLAITFVVGMRTKSPTVLNAVRRSNRRFMNPRQMESAGTPGAFASIIRHTGRKSGIEYETPIGAVVSDGGFVISLPYGVSADWLQNVLAAGSATLVHEGETYEVDQPQVVPIREANVTFSRADERAHRLFAVDECAVLRRVQPVPSSQATS